MNLSPKNAFSIDAYTDYQVYNSALNALTNNRHDFIETIQSKAPYYYYIHLDNNDKPLLVNYDEMQNREWINALTKVLPLTPNDEYLLYRRTDKISSIFRDVVNNDAFNDALGKDCIIFNELNRDRVQTLSKSIEGKVYALGKYFSKYKLYMCFDKSINNYIKPGDILVQGKFSKVGELEKKINYDILRNKEKIIKYSKTVYFEDGKINIPSPMPPNYKDMN